MVRNGAFSHRIDYIAIFKEILNLEGHQNCITGSRVTAILLNGWTDTILERLRDLSTYSMYGGGDDACISEHLPVFRAPRVANAPHQFFDEWQSTPVLPRQTIAWEGDRHRTDIATTRSNRPSWPIR